MKARVFFELCFLIWIGVMILYCLVLLVNGG